MKKIGLVLLVISFLVMTGSSLLLAEEQPQIVVNLEFSLDGGQTYSCDFPLLDKPQEIFVKVNWLIEGESREVKNGIITTVLYNEKEDFASALTGYHGRNENWRPDAWWQRLEKYWFSFYKEHSCIYGLDVRERPEGVIGFQNKGDREKKAFVDAPLPYCPALGPGTHKFTIILSYRIKDTGECIKAEEVFFVTIKGEEEGGKDEGKREQTFQKVATGINPLVKPKNPLLPHLEGEYIFGVDICKVIEGPNDIWKDEYFIKPKTNQEIGWKISDIKEGHYYIEILTESSSYPYRTGEEEFGPHKITPFIFLNGKAISFDRAGEIIPYKKTFVAIIQSEKPLLIKNGDEIRWNIHRTNKLVGSLVLSKKK